MEYPQLPIILENRNLSMEKDAVVMDRLRGVQEGFVLQYEGGYFAGFRLGGAVFDNTGKEIRRFRGDNGESHQAGFLKALRSRKTSDLSAPILEGHVSSAVCHLGNIAYRLGRPGDAQACQAALGSRPPIAEGSPGSSKASKPSAWTWQDALRAGSLARTRHEHRRHPESRCRGRRTPGTGPPFGARHSTRPLHLSGMIATEPVMKPLLILLAGLNLLAAAPSLATDALPPARGWAFEDHGGGLTLRLDGQQVADFVYRDARVLRPLNVMSRHVTPLILALCAQGASIHAADWPQFRGPNRDGKSPETGLLEVWPEAGPRLVRTITGVGGGFSSPVIAGERIYITGKVGDDLKIFCFDGSGRKIWERTHAPAFSEGDAPHSPYPGARAVEPRLESLATRLQRRIEWNSAEMRATNAPEAEPLIRKSYRTGFGLAG
jgi:hypothetical protein